MDVSVMVLLVASMGDQPEAPLQGMTAGTEGTGMWHPVLPVKDSS